MFYVYLLASKPYGTLYVGRTTGARTTGVGAQHRSNTGFAARHGVDRLVWFERHDSAEAAMRRERKIKEWKRDWKLNLIERDNPRSVDLRPNLSC